MYQFDLKAPGPRSQFVIAVATGLGALVSACGGGSSSPAPSSVTVAGAVTFDAVPIVPGVGAGAGLDYAGTVIRPARGVTVEFVDAGGTVATATTDDLGRYSLTLPPNRNGRLRVLAEMTAAGKPAWDFRVVDNTSGDAEYALDGASFSTGTRSSTRDLHAPSGWTGTGYGAERAAAPFALLDAVRDALDQVLGADPAVALPPLVIHWSPDNVPSTGTGIDVTTGDIGSSFYSRSLGGMFVLGAQNVDTDEYDRHVILHEFGHYLEAAVSRSDSIGGPHALGDVLDMRVALSEGWGNAFSAIASGDSIYSDSMGPLQASAPAFDVEGLNGLVAGFTPGWFSEWSVHEILYDIVDTAVDGADSVALGFPSLYAVLTGAYRSGVPLTSLFALLSELKANNPAAAPDIDALAAAQSISPVADAYGSGEGNSAGAQYIADVLPIYRLVTVGGAAANVCSTDEFASAQSNLVNKLATRRFLEFDVPAAGSVSVLVAASSIPAGQSADPDFVVHHGDEITTSEAAPSVACTNVAAAGWAPADCSETATLTLGAGPYVLEVYEYTNTLRTDATTPPVGRVCFDVTVTQP